MVRRRHDYAAAMALREDSFRRLRFLAESGRLAVAFGRHDKAHAIFDALRILAPQSPVGHDGLSELAFLGGDFERSVEWAKACLTLEHATPCSSAIALTRIACATATHGERRDVVESLDRAIKMDPAGPAGEHARLWKRVIRDMWTRTCSTES